MELILVDFDYILATSESFFFFYFRHIILSESLLFLLFLKFAGNLLGTSEPSDFRLLFFLFFLLAVFVQIVSLWVIDN